MAHRQKNRDGPLTRQRLNAALDPDTAHQDVLHHLENYGNQPYVSVLQMADDTVLLLRSLSQRLRHFQANILGSVKTPRPRNISDQETTDRRCTSISPVPPTGTGQPEFVHAINDRSSSPARRSTETGEHQPQVNLPVLENSSTAVQK